MIDKRRLALETDPTLVRIAGMIRRMAVSVTARALWQLVGFRMSDSSSETFTAEPFSGIGFYARPPTNGSPEAVVVMIGDAKTPAIVATRDEKTRAAIAGALKANESAVFNNLALLHIKDNGEIHARSKNGAAVSLATKSDLERIITALDVAVLALGLNPAAAALTALKTALQGLIPAWPAGTSKLKGE
jgi:phage gp45-like